MVLAVLDFCLQLSTPSLDAAVRHTHPSVTPNPPSARGPETTSGRQGCDGPRRPRVRFPCREAKVFSDFEPPAFMPSPPPRGVSALHVGCRSPINCSAAKSPPKKHWCSDDKCCPLGWVGGPLQHAAVGPRSTAPVRSTRKCPHPCRFGLTSCTATCTPPHVFPPERSVWVSRLTTRRSGCKFLNGKQDKRNRYAVTPHN